MIAAAVDRFEEAAAVLSVSENYRVLRRFVPDPAVYLGAAFTAPPGCKAGVFVDVETTGLNTRTDKIIELALVPFAFDADGVIYDAGKGLAFLQDPGTPIPPEVTAKNRITDDMVRGQEIDRAAVDEAVAGADLVVAHHAAFDRKMLERFSGVFRDKYWACSDTDVEWVDVFGCRARKLSIVLSDACGEFTDDNHRALVDCHLGVSVLARARAGGRTALGYLLESARRTVYRVWAIGSDFKKKDQLKDQGFRWSPDAPEGRKCWYRDFATAEEAAEVSMFARDIAGARPETVKLTGKDRFSIRAD